MSQFTEAYDRQQAFSAGFALAAKDWGLSDDEYAVFCKKAADMMEPIVPPAQPVAPAPQTPIVPITDQKQVDQARADNFAAQKAQAITDGGHPQQKAAAAAPPLPPAMPPEAPTGVLPKGQSALNPVNYDRVKKWEDSQKAKPAPQVRPQKTSPGALSPALGKWLQNPGF